MSAFVRRNPWGKSYKLYPTLGRFGVIADNLINIGYVLAESTDH
jgi:hypothetical protein